MDINFAVCSKLGKSFLCEGTPFLIFETKKRKMFYTASKRFPGKKRKTVQDDQFRPKTTKPTI